MGQPVVHFEVIGKDGESLQRYYSGLFGWEIDSNNPMKYGSVPREGNVSADGIGIGGGVGQGPEGYDGHVTFYVEVPDVEAALAKAEGLGGSRVMGPEKMAEGIEIGLFTDPEGHVVGVVKIDVLAGRARTASPRAGAFRDPRGSPPRACRRAPRHGRRARAGPSPGPRRRRRRRRP